MIPDDWKPKPLNSGQTLCLPIGDAVFHVRHTGYEWQVARQIANESTQAMVWKRVAAGDEEHTLEPVPVMPDRAVIVRPEAPIHLPPGRAALFYVSIPLWVRLTAGADRALTLCDDPCVTLSSIWYGEPTAGQLCYSLRTRARRDDAGDAANQPHRAVCKVTMRNEAAKSIEFVRLCLPAQQLNTYMAPDHLWTDDVSVIFESETMNRVRITGRPAEASSDTPAGPAREVPPSGHYVQRSFGALRSLFG